MADQAKCRHPKCDRPLFWIGTGRRPTLCPEHAPTKPRHDPKKKLIPVPAEESSRADVDGVRRERVEKAKSTAELLAPIRRAAESQLKDLGERADENQKAINDAAFQAECMGALLVLMAVSTGETIDLTPPGNKPFGIGKLLDAYERLGGSEGAVTQIVNSYTVEVAE